MQVVFPAFLAMIQRPAWQGRNTGRDLHANTEGDGRPYILDVTTISSAPTEDAAVVSRTAALRDAGASAVSARSEIARQNQLVMQQRAEGLEQRQPASVLDWFERRATNVESSFMTAARAAHAYSAEPDKKSAASGFNTVL